MATTIVQIPENEDSKPDSNSELQQLREQQAMILTKLETLTALEKTEKNEAPILIAKLESLETRMNEIQNLLTELEAEDEEEKETHELIVQTQSQELEEETEETGETEETVAPTQPQTKLQKFLFG